MRKRILYLLLITLTMGQLAEAQVTTSNLTGTVRDQAGQPLAGATITATNTATGVVYQVTSNSRGAFNIFNMAPGGPYRIDVSYTGFETFTRNDVQLALGEAAAQDFTLIQNTQALAEVVVTTTRTSTNRIGSETTIGRDKIAN